MLLVQLPPELYSAILSFVDDDVLQRTTLSLTRAVPHSPIPLKFLFANIRLRQPHQVVQLDRRLRGKKEDALLVLALRMEVWSADAEVVTNLLALLDNLKVLVLYVGPYFAPESLQAICEKHRPSLESLSLRFRP